MLALVVATGVSFTFASSWTERLLLATVLCGLVLLGFHLLVTHPPL
jgi:hypothetical protein